MARYVAPEFDILTAFSAACAAQRINGEYLKQDVNLYDDAGSFIRADKIANKILMTNILCDTTGITDADREQAGLVIKHCQGISFKLIMGKSLSDFEQVMLRLADQQTVSSKYDLAVIASLPATYERSQVRHEIDVRLRQANGILDCAINTKIEEEIEVVRCNYSNAWSTFYVTGLTASENVVFFAFRSQLEVGSKINIKGKIKAHKENRTQLSHVKVK